LRISWGVIHNALNILNISAFYQFIAIGAVIVVAVEIDVLRRAFERRRRAHQGELREAATPPSGGRIGDEALVTAGREIRAISPDEIRHISQAETILEVANVGKRFGALQVLDGVNLQVRAGEVLALLGDNGAGKSTLVKCISGVHEPDTGTIRIAGTELTIYHPAEARKLGVETVYQDLALFENLQAFANFFAGREVAGPGWLPEGLRLCRDKVMFEHSRAVIDGLEVRVPDLRRPVATMSGGQRQAVAVARAAAFSAPLVILDEPTAALGVRESHAVLGLISRLAKKRVGVILISHNMEHVMAVAHRAVVLRRGRVAGEVIPGKETEKEVVAFMVGA